MLVGRFVLNFFGISLPVLKIAGGLIVANTAWGMVTASSRITTEESSEAMTKDDISLTPMAMPMLSGPGSIGVVMGLAAHVNGFLAYIGMVIGIMAVGLSVYLFLRHGRAAGEAPGSQRDGRSHAYLRISDSGDCGAVGVGRSGRLQVNSQI